MPSKRLYLRGLPQFVGEDEVLKYLSNYGKIVEVKILGDYGFVQFDSEKDAVDVVDTFRGQPFLGKDIVVEFAHPLRKEIATTESGNRNNPSVTSSQPRTAPAYVQTRYPVVVTNLPREICWQELKDFGRLSGGLVSYCDLDKNRRGRGFIEYIYQGDAERAIQKLDGRALGGNLVNVFAHKPFNNNRRWQGRSRSPPERHYTRLQYTSSPVPSSRRTVALRRTPPHSPARYHFPYGHSAPPRSPHRQYRPAYTAYSDPLAFSITYSDETYDYSNQVTSREPYDKVYDHDYNHDFDRHIRGRYDREYWEDEYRRDRYDRQGSGRP